MKKVTRVFCKTIKFLSVSVIFTGLIHHSLFGQEDEQKKGWAAISVRQTSKLRLQFLVREDSIELWVTNLASIPKVLKKIKVTTPPTRLTRRKIITHAAQSLDQVYAMQQDTILGFRLKKISPQQFQFFKLNFLSGKRKQPFFSHQWVKLGIIPLTP